MEIFVKANVPGWKSLIPFYNIYLWIKLSGTSNWIVILLLIPIVNIFIIIYINNEVSQRFNKVSYLAMF